MKKRNIFLGLLCSLLIILSFPGFSLYPLAWVALVPLFYAIDRTSVIKSMLIGLLVGFVTYLGILRWILPTVIHMTDNRILSVVLWGLLSLCPAMFFAVFCGFVALVRRTNTYTSLFVIPAFWVSLEFVHFKLLESLPWTYYFLGYSQWVNPRIIQISAFTSVAGVSFLIVLVNVAIFFFLKHKKKKELGIAVLLFALCFAYGTWKYDFEAKEDRGEKIRIAVLQGNIDSMIKWSDKKEKADFIAQTYLDLNRKALEENPDLIVWTETAIPWPVEEGDNLIEEALKITYPAGASHLIGIVTDASNGAKEKYYNSAYFVLPDGQITGAYHKIKLLDFIEAANSSDIYMDQLDFGNNVKNYIPGGEQGALRTHLGNIAIFICNENTYPYFIRNSIKKGGEYIIGLTNESFLRGNIRESHFAINTFRAVENNRDVLVASNVGFSALIDAYGRTIDISRTDSKQVFAGEVSQRNAMTFYTKYGDVFSFLCMIATALYCLKMVYYGIITKCGRAA